jgi:hypothetical protein
MTKKAAADKAKKELKIRVKCFLPSVSTSKIDPFPTNVKRHPREQTSAFDKLLKKIGFAGVLLVREKANGRYECLDGHMRVGMMPDTELPCIVLDLNDSEAKALVMTYDHSALLAKIDRPALLKLARQIPKTYRAAVAPTLNLKELQDLTGTTEELKGEIFARPKDASSTPKVVRGVPLVSGNISAWVYCDLTGGTDEGWALKVLGTGLSQELDKTKFMAAVNMYAKKHHIERDG